MGLDPFEITILVIGALGALILLILGRPALMSGGRGRLPKRFELVELGHVRIPKDVREPLAYLSTSLSRMGFTSPEKPLRPPVMSGFGRHLMLVPFVHEKEKALFIMGIESQLFGNSEMMLHIISPLENEQSIQTTTLAGLTEVTRPPGVDVQVVLDADSIEEIWSRHRRALLEHELALRTPVTVDNWRNHAGFAYEAWLKSALHANRLTLDLKSNSYRIRPLSRRLPAKGI